MKKIFIAILVLIVGAQAQAVKMSCSFLGGVEFPVIANNQYAFCVDTQNSEQKAVLLMRGVGLTADLFRLGHLRFNCSGDAPLSGVFLGLNIHGTLFVGGQAGYFKDKAGRKCTMAGIQVGVDAGITYSDAIFFPCEELRKEQPNPEYMKYGDPLLSRVARECHRK